jgi:pre-mRNA-splicing factor CDC5/CEF1
MKAAGIEMPKLKRKVQGIDYGTEIPFQKQAPIGFYEVDFQSEKDELKQPFKSIDLDKLKRKRMNEVSLQINKIRKK